MLKFDELYSWVRDLPIIDWHNHLDLKTLAEDRPLGSLYEVWVKADPYKHRAMRICGEPEELVTGGAANGQDARCPSDGESAKWAAWMRTLPKLVGNPIFAWAKMELEFLGLDPEPYLHGCGKNVSLANWTPSKMLRAFGVEAICPCLGAEQLGQRASCPLVAPALGQRASRPLVASALGQRASCPLVASALGQRASRPLVWTAPRMWLSPGAEDDTSAHFSHSLMSEDFHHRNLPHVGQNGTLVFVTFRLGDSLPAERWAELEELRRQDRQSGAGSDLTREEIEKIDAWLDAGFGSCVLADEKCRRIVEDALAYFDAGNQRASRTGTTGVPPVGGARTGTTGVPPVGGARTGTTGVPPVGGARTGTTGVPPVGGRSFASIVNGQDARCPSEGAVNGQDARCPSEGVPPVDVRSRYRLHAYVVMPNHVHVLFELFDAADLANVLHSWKSYTAKAINRELGQTGALWREEYYDRLIRDGQHYRNVISYLRKNERAAKTIAGVNGQDARCPSEGAVNGQDARCPSEGAVNGQDARCPSEGDVNGQDARCPSYGAVSKTPSLRMNAGERISHEALERFEAAGCRVVDISVDDTTKLEAEFDSLASVAAFAAAHGWTMLLHLGALRETSARLRAAAGPAGGFAGMRAPVDPAAVARFLNRLESGDAVVLSASAGSADTGPTGVPPVGGARTGTTGVPPVGGARTGTTGVPPVGGARTGTTGVPPVGGRSFASIVNGQDARCPSKDAVNGQDARCPSKDAVNGQDARCPSERCSGDAHFASALPRTILLSLNPEAHAQLAVLAGSFNGEGMPGKVQLGPAWWWCDHEEGIRDVLEKNAAYGVLSTFIGMTTDSRSILSFVRHDYFRRILCQWTAEKIAAGAFPDDESLIRPILENICYNNAKGIIS